jgi:hypothetical protein
VTWIPRAVLLLTSIVTYYYVFCQPCLGVSFMPPSATTGSGVRIRGQVTNQITHFEAQSNETDIESGPHAPRGMACMGRSLSRSQVRG